MYMSEWENAFEFHLKYRIQYYRHHLDTFIIFFLYDEVMHGGRKIQN